MPDDLRWNLWYNYINKVFNKYNVLESSPTTRSMEKLLSIKLVPHSNNVGYCLLELLLSSALNLSLRGSSLSGYFLSHFKW